MDHHLVTLCLNEWVSACPWRGRGFCSLGASILSLSSGTQLQGGPDRAPSHGPDAPLHTNEAGEASLGPMDPRPGTLVVRQAGGQSPDKEHPFWGLAGGPSPRCFAMQQD
ncbi:hypothetical protein NDU88_005266 [Pleurodeles waltl]|uniref:Uncharacterized protein n=1 Tax=Pleurodeles waltl TaxID=8319 RepID=A0AAV7VJG9_PLEWA|nr:hypothetical protein NDU88_005266 [Pleurodeles waltl]